MTALDKQAREWLNKKHFTSDAGVTLDVIAMMPDEHALAINIRQLSQLLAAYGKTVATQVREQTVAECAQLLKDAIYDGESISAEIFNKIAAPPETTEQEER